jgi:Sec-independent protein secretion pathway component TatC
VLTVGRTSAVILAMGTLAYILTPPSVLSSLRLHENPTLLYMVGYYVLLCLGAYALAAPLRSRWHRDSGLPY